MSPTVEIRGKGIAVTFSLFLYATGKLKESSVPHGASLDSSPICTVESCSNKEPLSLSMRVFFVSSYDLFFFFSLRPSSYVAFQSNIMQTKLIKEMKFAVKRRMNRFVELNSSRRFIPSAQTDKTADMRVSSDASN